MKKYLFIVLLVGLTSGQVSNPCEDERFIKISEKYVDQMTEEEYQYYLQKDKECAEYDKNNATPDSLDNNTLKIRLSSGQVSNPCEDERFIKISEKYVDQMTEEEYQYYLQKDKECAEYDKNNDNQKPLENNPLKVDNIDSLENLSVSNKPINLWPIIFLILIISLI